MVYLYAVIKNGQIVASVNMIDRDKTRIYKNVNHMHVSH